MVSRGQNLQFETGGNGSPKPNKGANLREVLWDAEFGSYKVSPYRIRKNDDGEYEVIGPNGKIHGRSTEKSLCVDWIIRMELAQKEP